MLGCAGIGPSTVRRGRLLAAAQQGLLGAVQRGGEAPAFGRGLGWLCLGAAELQLLCSGHFISTIGYAAGQCLSGR